MITTTAIRSTAAAPGARFDLYSSAHKALRALMADTLVSVGRLDVADAQDFAAGVAKVRELLAACTTHLQKENRYVHAAIEARAPGATQAIAGEHVGHEQAIAALEAELASLEHADAPARPGHALRLYRRLGLFMAENMVHMHEEETAMNALLWEHCTDDELRALHATLVRLTPRDALQAFARWLIPASTPADRAGMLAGMRAESPAIFADMIEIARTHLSRADWIKLATTLGCEREAA